MPLQDYNFPFVFSRKCWVLKQSFLAASLVPGVFRAPGRIISTYSGTSPSPWCRVMAKSPGRRICFPFAVGCQKVFIGCHQLFCMFTLVVAHLGFSQMGFLVMWDFQYIDFLLLYYLDCYSLALGWEECCKTVFPSPGNHLAPLTPSGHLIQQQK